jgi:LmbE family N-acetylglucosaminyl deacetylase
VVLAHDPWKRYRLHPDHRHAGLLATDGVVAARDATFFPDQPHPQHRPETLLLFEADEPDHVEEVTGFAEAKVDALLAHRSQLRSTMLVGEAQARTELRTKVERLLTDVADAAVRAAASDAAVQAGSADRLASCRMAEAFKLIDDL